MPEIFEYVINGILLGAIYGVLAFPICLLFSATGYVDLAIGAYAVLAAIIAYSIGGSSGVLIGLLAAVAASGVTGIISLRLDRSMTDHITVVLASYGTSVFIESFVLTFFGEQPVISQLFSQNLSVGPVSLSAQGILNFVVAVLILGAIYGVLFRTSLGRDMRASSINAVGATIAGVSVPVLWFSTYLAGGLLAGVAGILILYTTGADYHGGLSLLLSAFGAAILFGMNHPLRAFLGGLTIGLVQSFSAGYLVGGWVNAVPLLVIFAVLSVSKVNSVSARIGRV